MDNMQRLVLNTGCAIIDLTAATLLRFLSLELTASVSITAHVLSRAISYLSFMMASNSLLLSQSELLRGLATLLTHARHYT